MKKHIKALGVMIGAILLFKVVAIIIQLFMRDVLKINLMANIVSSNEAVRKVAGIQTSISGIAMDLLVFLVLVVIFFNKGGLIERVKLNRGYSPKKLKFIISAAWGGILVGGVFSAIAVAILGTNPITTVMFNEMFRTPLGIIQAVIIAPIVEETLLRGVVFNYLRKDYKLGTAIILQALTFGILHGNVAQGFNAFIIGIVLAIIYLYTDSLWGDITAHMLINGTVVVITILKLNGNTTLLNIVSLIILLVIIVSLVIAIRIYIKNVSKVVWQKDGIAVESNNSVIYSEDYLKEDTSEYIATTNDLNKGLEKDEANIEYKELKKPNSKKLIIGVVIILAIIIVGAKGYNIVENNYSARMLIANKHMNFIEKIKYGADRLKQKEELQNDEKKILSQDNKEEGGKYVNGQVTSKEGVSPNIYNNTEFVGISDKIIYKRYDNQILKNTNEKGAELIIRYYNPNNLTKGNLVDFYNQVVKPSKKTYYLLDIYKPTYGICFYVSGSFNAGDLDNSYIIKINNHMIIGNIEKDGKITTTSGNTGKKINFKLGN